MVVSWGTKRTFYTEHQIVSAFGNILNRGLGFNNNQMFKWHSPAILTFKILTKGDSDTLLVKPGAKLITIKTLSTCAVTAG